MTARQTPCLIIALVVLAACGDADRDSPVSTVVAPDSTNSERSPANAATPPDTPQPTPAPAPAPASAPQPTPTPTQADPFAVIGPAVVLNCETIGPGGDPYGQKTQSMSVDPNWAQSGTTTLDSDAIWQWRRSESSPFDAWGASWTSDGVLLETWHSGKNSNRRCNEEPLSPFSITDGFQTGFGTAPTSFLACRQVPDFADTVVAPENRAPFRIRADGWLIRSGLALYEIGVYNKTNYQGQGKLAQYHDNSGFLYTTFYSQGNYGEVRFNNGVVSYFHNYIIGTNGVKRGTECVPE